MKKWWKPKRNKGTIHALTLCTDVEAIEVYRMGVEALRRQRWISVTERLPDMGQGVLVYSHNNGVLVDYYDRGLFAFADVTHWMSLPEPPEEGEPGND